MTRRERSRVRKIGLSAKVAVSVVFAVAAFWLAGYIYAQLDQYRAYRVYEYTSVPNEVCPLGSIQVSLDRYYDPDASVIRISTSRGWQRADDPHAPLIGQENVTVEGGMLDDLPPGRHTVPSSILGQIPTKPGEYRTIASHDVTRRILMFRPTLRTTVRSEGVALRASAGNDGTTTPQYPAHNEDVVAVGALDRTAGWKRASFSNYGSWVDLWMNGVAVACYDGAGNLTSKFGTSLASPLATYMHASLLTKGLTSIGQISTDEAVKQGADTTPAGVGGGKRVNAERAAFAMKDFC